MNPTDEARSRYVEAFVHAQNLLGAAELILLSIEINPDTFALETPLAEFMKQIEEEAAEDARGAEADAWLNQHTQDAETTEEMLAGWTRFLGRAFTPEERRSFTLEQAVRKLMHRGMILTQRTVLYLERVSE